MIAATAANRTRSTSADTRGGGPGATRVPGRRARRRRRSPLRSRASTTRTRRAPGDAARSRDRAFLRTASRPNRLLHVHAVGVHAVGCCSPGASGGPRCRLGRERARRDSRPGRSEGRPLLPRLDVAPRRMKRHGGSASLTAKTAPERRE
jgi:hypothetical protein